MSSFDDLPIVQSIQVLQAKGIPIPLPTDQEIVEMSHPLCPGLYQFFQLKDPIFSEYLYFLDLHNLDQWKTMASILNSSTITPEALTHLHIQDHLMVYLDKYDVVKTFTNFDLQVWIDYDLSRVKLFDNDDLIIEGDQIWTGDKIMSFDVLLKVKVRSPKVIKKIYEYLYHTHKPYIWTRLPYLDVEMLKALFEIVDPETIPNRKVVIQRVELDEDDDDESKSVDTDTIRDVQPEIEYLRKLKLVPFVCFNYHVHEEFGRHSESWDNEVEVTSNAQVQQIIDEFLQSTN